MSGSTGVLMSGHMAPLSGFNTIIRSHGPSSAALLTKISHLGMSGGGQLWGLELGLGMVDFPKGQSGCHPRNFYT